VEDIREYLAIGGGVVLAILSLWLKYRDIKAFRAMGWPDK
jgi:hypothetical protein